MAKLKEKLYDKIQEWRPRTARLLNEYGNTVVDQITIGQIIGGMRGMKSLVTDSPFLSLSSQSGIDSGLIMR